MKKFRYSLETVMDFKEQVLDRLQGEYAECMAKVTMQKNFVNTLYGKRTELELEFGRLKMRGGPIQRFQLFQDVIDKRNEEIKLEEARLRKLEEIANEKKAEVVEAKVDKSKYEKLREKKLDEYKKVAAKADEQFIEEFVMHAQA